MADSNAQPDQINEEQQEKKLKYLDFVHAAAIQAMVCVSSLYGYAKENAGPLKPGVQAVEGTVRTVVSPVVDKFHDVPLELLSFIDRKVDESVQELERHVPLKVKKTYIAAQKAPEVARSMADEVRRAGVVGTAAGIARAAYTRYEAAAKGIYAKYEPAVEQCAVAAWQSLNRVPLFPQVAHIVVPTAAHWSERYNQAVCYTAERGYVVSAYLPLVPTERIAKVFDSSASAEVAAAAE